VDETANPFRMSEWHDLHLNTSLAPYNFGRGMTTTAPIQS